MFDKLLEVVKINGVRYGHYLHTKNFMDYNKSIGNDVQEDYWMQMEI